jgi:hypothetical protein
MGRFLKTGFFRKVDKQYNDGDISHSKMLELIEGEVIKNYNKTVMEYKNRHGDTYQFEYNENGNIDWRGKFKWNRFGFETVDGEDVTLYIDPSGGPFIGIDTDMSRFGLKGIVKGFVIHEDYYEIIIDK